ncbi:hypothetical protein PHISCL_01934 [Aspergillus sclerotialis]|uniref:DUF4139 domain-containing protein n=1 Tax=Aspergillus sclerotialis TaxID=2070753 RepID=A0A3A2ZRT9_9EURO|nr:hypothetical protein PHISCL_01934 [Aspergillus sclerotialis]
MADICTSEITVSGLPTKSVTLTPYRATVVREVRTTIQPGPNEITILGLDPNIITDSIRVEGTGSATITDIQTAVVPRGEQFDDVYPPEDEVASSDDDDEDDEDADSDGTYADDAELGRLREEIVRAEMRLAKARNKKIMTQTMLEFLDTYGRKMEPEHTDAAQVGEFLALYARQRSADATVHHDAIADEGNVERELGRLYARYVRREERHRKTRKAALKARRRRKQLALRKRTQLREQTERRRLERKKFWTENMGQVVVHLDGHLSVGTSVSSSGAEGNDDGFPVVLVLSYVLPRAMWASRYELGISTPSASAHMVYRAEFFNFSAETWQDTRVTLSTSEASWSRLDEVVPSLTPWHIRLEPLQKDINDKSSWNRILDDKSKFNSGITTAQIQPMATKPLFGGSSQQQAQTGLFGRPAQQSPPSTGGLFGSARTQNDSSSQGGSSFGAGQNQTPPPPSAGLFGAAPSQPLGVFGNAPAQGQAQQPVAFGQGAPQPSPATVEQVAQPQPNPPPDTHEHDDGDQTIDCQSLEHHDSVKQDYGMTTTYELQGSRTIVPSNIGRRHVLAELDLKDVTLSHIIVPKRRPAAFLRARIKNTSSTKFLRGRLGLTVDGIFLGTCTLDNCRHDDDFQVSLGIDPSILVAYAKPMVRRVTGGFFAKEDAAVFRRSCWVKNTKSIPVDVIVSDQVPVSQDEKLRVNIVEPKGLENKDGAQAMIEMMEDTGHGTATMVKDGEIKWTIRLEPGKDFRVVLEYETRAPLGSEVV